MSHRPTPEPLSSINGNVWPHQSSQWRVEPAGENHGFSRRPRSACVARRVLRPRSRLYTTCERINATYESRGHRMYLQALGGIRSRPLRDVGGHSRRCYEAHDADSDASNPRRYGKMSNHRSGQNADPSTRRGARVKTIEVWVLSSGERSLGWG